MNKKPSFFQAILPILAMFAILVIGYGIFRLKIEPLLICATIVAALVGKSIGLTWDDMMEGIIDKITKSLSAILILITVGILIGTWMLSGTIPMMVYYGLQFISPHYLFVTAFLVTALVSTFTGTSWGSAGTVGVAIIGVAMVLGVSLPITAGAIIAGAYFGDKMSPLSDTTNLAPIAAGSELYEHIRHLLYTTVPASIVGLIIYWFVGRGIDVSGVAREKEVEAMLSTLDALFNWNILLIIPVVLVIGGAIKKLPTIPVMIASSALAIALGLAFQSVSLASAFESVASGFNIDMIKMEGLNTAAMGDDVKKLLNRGGMSSMLGTVLIAFCAFAFAGIISKAGCLEVILEKINEKAKSQGSLVFSTVAASITMAITTGNSYLSILIPGELFRDVYVQRGLHPKNLSRTLEDSGSVVVPLIPWSMAGVYMSTTLGVPVQQYAPWAIMCYLGLVFAIIYGYTGFAIAKLDKGSDDMDFHDEQNLQAK